MLQTSAANQFKHPIVSFRTRVASAGEFSPAVGSAAEENA